MKLHPLTIHSLHCWSRPVARRDPPRERPVARKLLGIADRVLLLHVDRAPAVFEIVDALATHVVVPDVAEVDPHVRQVMNEERPGVKKVVTVDSLPVVRPGPRAITLFRKRIRGRSQAENVQNQRFAVPGPAITDELRLWFPTVTDGERPVLGPPPIGALIKRRRELPQLAF